MEKFESVEAVLDFAIEREQEAFDLYHGLASQTTDPKLEALFTSFAKVEAGHKLKLEGIKEGTTYLPVRQNPVDMKIADYLVEVEPSPEMSFQDALVLAVKRERAANALYTQLAASICDPLLSELFSQLAKEEMAHKVRFEDLYEENFLSEN
ncbi:MAG: ferritin family protein [Kiritimatiellales bacterium]|nr:ferritin family protein [Kiritimatiellales bacterium]